MHKAKTNLTSSLLPMVAMLFVFIACASCRNRIDNPDVTDAESEISSMDISGEPGAPTFFGDTTLTIVSANRPNGYQVKLFLSKDLTLLNLSRGDSINRFIDLGELPLSLCYTTISELLDGDGKPAVRGTYKYEIDISVVDSIHKAVKSIVFMDVDFDGEEELVMSSEGYNRHYFKCYDLTGENHGTLLQPMDEPFNKFVFSDYDNTFTVFDSKKKTIHIRERVGANCCYDTWCAFTKDSEFDQSELNVVRKERVETSADGVVTTTTWKRVEGELKQVSETRKKQ